MTEPTPTRAEGLTDEQLEMLLSQHEAGNVGAIHQLGNHLTEFAKEVRDSRRLIKRMRKSDKSLHDTIEKLVQAGADALAENQALRERAEAAEADKDKLRDVYIGAQVSCGEALIEIEELQKELAEARAQAALAWEAGQDAAAKVAELYRDRWPHAFAPDATHEVKSQYVQMTRAARIIAEQSRDLTPPADLSAALTARLDAELDRAVDALEADAKNGDISEGALQWCLDTIRALRRAAPTEGEA